MCGPLDRVQVDAFLVHFPERRKLPQLRHFSLDQVYRVIDLFLGGEAPEGEANRAVRELVRAPERAQHVRGLERGRGARRARRHREVLHRHDQRLALDEVERDVDVVRDALLDVPVHIRFLDALDALEQPVAQGADALVLGGHFELGEARGFAEADDLVRRERSGAEAALVPAAMDLRFEPHAWLAANVERADALRAIHLVRRDRQQIGLQLLRVDLDFAAGLHGVAVKNDSLRATNVGDFPHRLDHADLVVHHHDRDEDRVRADGGLDLVEADDAVVFHAQIGDLETLSFELAAGVEHGLVLGLLRDDVLALGLVELRRALDREVVALGRAGSPDDFLRIRMNERSDVAARLLDRLLRLPAERVRAARGVAEEFREVRNHLRRDAGIDRGRRRVVEVDRQLHAATFSSGFLKSLITATGLPLWCATRSASVTDERYSYIFSFSVAPRSCVMQRLSSWQFSLPPHCVASSGSSTAVTMSATEMALGACARL